MSKMYIAVLTDVPDYMVPTLVAHSAINGHIHFRGFPIYEDWLANSFKKVVVRVNNKEFDKIRSTLECWEGHENKTLGGLPSCLVVMPVQSDNTPNVLKFAKMWKPKEETDDRH